MILGQWAGYFDRGERHTGNNVDFISHCTLKSGWIHEFKKIRGKNKCMWLSLLEEGRVLNNRRDGANVNK